MAVKAVVILTFCCTAFAQNAGVTVAVDANAGRHAINPNIYGVAFATTAQLSDLNVPINRYGGNNSSRYNWQLNADNRDQDWYFESIPDASSVAGERGDTFISTSRAGGAQAMITVPIIGWVAKLGPNRAKLGSFSQAKYGAQTGSDPYFTDAGNGILQSTGQYVTGNDPNDADVPNSSNYQQQWIQAIVNKWGLAARGGQPYYLLDNEHSIWFASHRDVHPDGPTMDEILTRMEDYASHIKAVDPGALVAGPEEWGWSGYFYSGYDQQYGAAHNWSSFPDRMNHGGQDYLPWLLTQLKSDGRRLLDIVSIHYYPEGGEFGNDVSTNMQLLRNKSTRSLWDPNYVDQSWINDKVMLIPRLRSWADTYYYPGTPIALTEYNWGAEAHINGATTQADILGIFGRQGLDLAARWTTPAASTPTYKAIKIYRNYDGQKSGFGDVSVSATVVNPDNVAAFAAQRTPDGALTVMVISKYLSGTTPVTVSLANFSGSGTAQAYQLSSANAITRLADLTYSGSSVAFTAPAQSITLLVLPKGALPTALSVTPGTGGGLAQTFTALYSDPSGAADLQVGYLDFGPSIFAAHSCIVAYAQAGKNLYLFNDTNSAALGPIVAGTNATLSNSQCTLSSSGGVPAPAGNNLSVPYAITFAAAFAGSKNIYGLAQSYSGSNGGWQTLGTWTPGTAAALGAVSVTPNSGSGPAQTFRPVYSDPNGASDLQVVYLDFGTGIDSQHSCIVAYVPASNALYLFNDTNGGVSNAVTPGNSSTVQNSQCTLSGAGGAVSAAGNNLTVPVALTFAPGFTGAKNVYGLAQNYSGANGGWQTLGTWTPSAATSLNAVSVTPSSGSGIMRAFSAVYTDPNGASDLQVIYLDFGASIFAANSCIVGYIQSSNQVFLFNDTNSATSGSIVEGGGGSVNNSQCTLSAGSTPVSIAGNNLTVPFTITFAGGFTGSKTVWGLAQSYGGMQSGWQMLGTWTP